MNITEKDVREFVTNVAISLKQEFGANEIYLGVHKSLFSSDYGVPVPCKWTVSINGAPQIATVTLEELREAISDSLSSARKITRIAALRKEADELKASIAQEVAK